jgi:pimeloyl-ACP methyl ester carboxylesterase
MSEKLPLLLLPGLLCDRASWTSTIDELADISAPHVVSFGLSDSISSMADTVLSEAPRVFAIAGHSMGGRVALEVYRRAPGRVARLGLLCTDYRGHISEVAREQEILAGDAMLAAARNEGMGAVARMLCGRALPPNKQQNKVLVNELTAMIARHTPAHLEAQLKAGLNRPDFSELLPEISCPTLICAGEKDVMRPVEIHRDMAANIQSAKLVVIKDGGHMIAMEHPDQVVAAMRSWLVS